MLLSNLSIQPAVRDEQNITNVLQGIYTLQIQPHLSFLTNTLTSTMLRNRV